MQTEMELSESQVAQLQEMIGHHVGFHWNDWRCPDSEALAPSLPGESTSYLMPTALFGYLRVFGPGTSERVYLSHIVGRSPGHPRSTVVQAYNDFATYGGSLIIRQVKRMDRKGMEVVLGNGELSGQEIFSGIVAYVRDRKMDVDAEELRRSLGEGLIRPADTLATEYEQLQRKKLEYVKCLHRIA